MAREWQQLERVKEVFLLRMKNSGKELDPRHFDQKERTEFDLSDQKGWESWLENQTVRILEPEEASKVRKSLIFQVPLRVIRTNRGKLVNGVVDKLMAKSRLVAPGHMDPQLGELRTDSPTTQPLAVALTATVAALLGWSGFTFDVMTAFLSGKATEREVYVRAPSRLASRSQGSEASEATPDHAGPEVHLRPC